MPSIKRCLRVLLRHAFSGVDSSLFLLRSLPSLGGPATFAMGRCLWMWSCKGRWPSVMGWVPPGLCLWTSSCMWLPKTCLECWFTYLWYAASPRMAAPQLAQQQMHTHASSCRVEMMAIARHQPLTACPPNHARKRPVKPAYTSATILRMLAKHSTHAKQAAATPPAAPVASAPVVSPSAASAPAAAPPAAPAPAQQQAMTQFRTMMPPTTPHTVGSAVCGALLPTIGTLTGGATAGSGASGTLGSAPATFSVAPAKPLPTWPGAAAAVLAAWPATGISGARRLPSVAGTKPTRAMKQPRANEPDIFDEIGRQYS